MERPTKETSGSFEGGICADVPYEPLNSMLLRFMGLAYHEGYVVTRRGFSALRVSRAKGKPLSLNYKTRGEHFKRVIQSYAVYIRIGMEVAKVTSKESMDELAKNFMEFVTHIADANILERIIVAAIAVVVVALVCHILVKAIQRFLSIDSVSLSQTSIVVNIVRIVVWGIGICFIADVCFNVNMTAIIAALGVGGIAISLGFQNTLSNLFGGVQVTLTRVIEPGDNIRVGTNQGVVQDINWSYTTIRNLSGETVIIPNSLMASNAVTHLPPVEKVSVPIVVMKDLGDLDSLAVEIEKTALKAAEEYDAVVKKPEVSFNKVTNEGLYGSIVLTITDGLKASTVSDAITRAIAPLVQDDRIHRFETTVSG